MDNLVRIYPDALSVKECDRLVDKFEEFPSLQKKQAEGEMSFSQIDFLEHAKVFGGDFANIISSIAPYIDHYKKDINSTNFPSYSFEAVRMKKYEPNGIDQFGTHIDVTNKLNCLRFLVMFYYLSDNDEGSTVIEPIGNANAASPCKKGSLIMFPPFWTHPHRGEAPIAKPKYILGSYLHYV
jgi:hypothetical protein